MLVQAQPKSNASKVAVDLYADLLDSIKGESLVPVWIEDGKLNVDDLTWPLDSPGRILLAGCGKASASMALGVERVLGERIDDGLIITKIGHGLPFSRCRVVESGHPIPDKSSVLAGQEMLAFASSCKEDDLVIFVLSGGASTLMEIPEDGLELDDLIQTNRVLLNSGLDIRAMNRVRARLSKIKGGKLGAAFGKATVFGLVMNDIIGGGIEEVGSGPLKSSLGHPGAVLRSELVHRLPASVVRAFGRPAEKIVNDNVVLRSIASAWTVKQTLASICAENRLQVKKNVKLSGDGRKQIEKIDPWIRQLKSGQCLFAYGESTLEVRGPGKGGRCQELALLVAMAIRGRSDLAVLVAGTDGTDGPTDAAGALVDGQTLATDVKVEEAARVLDCNDSYTFHERNGTLVRTGPTGSNLNDVLIAVCT